jgi:hypothetical protein
MLCLGYFDASSKVHDGGSSRKYALGCDWLTRSGGKQADILAEPSIAHISCVATATNYNAHSHRGLDLMSYQAVLVIISISWLNYIRSLSDKATGYDKGDA